MAEARSQLPSRPTLVKNRVAITPIPEPCSYQITAPTLGELIEFIERLRIPGQLELNFGTNGGASRVGTFRTSHRHKLLP